MSMPGKVAHRAIKRSVGARGVNTDADVRLIQNLLNQPRNQPPVPYREAVLTVDGDCGGLTVDAIERFQSAVLKWGGRSVDGRVDPKGKTWRALNGNVASCHDILPMQLDWQSVAALKCAASNAGARMEDDMGPPEPPQIDDAGRAKAYTKVNQWRYDKSVLGHRYGEDKDGDGEGDKWTSVRNAGCALSSLTMAATRIGSATPHWPNGLTPRDLTVLQANEICKKAGAFTRQSLLMGQAAAALGMAEQEYGFNRANAKMLPLPENAVDQIYAHLMTDRPVAAHVDYKAKGGKRGDHWVLLTNVQGDGKVRAIDPSGGKFMTFTKSSTNNARFEETQNGILFGESGVGFGPATTANQKNYCVVRYILLTEIAGDAAAQ